MPLCTKDLVDILFVMMWRHLWTLRDETFTKYLMFYLALLGKSEWQMKGSSRS